MIIYLPLLIAILGAFVYAFAVNPKLAEIGRLSYLVGLWVFLWLFGGPLVSVLHR